VLHCNLKPTNIEQVIGLLLFNPLLIFVTLVTIPTNARITKNC